MLKYIHATLMFLIAPYSAMAKPPPVATDIAPVHALVQAVMQGIGVPELVMPPGASPHSYAMRPSEAYALENAELVFWVGEVLTPWLSGPISTLASDAIIITLTNAPGTHVLPLHDEPGNDPHMWLDPHNADVWLNEIARQLAMHDPENAAQYWANANQMQSEIRQVTAEISSILSPVRGLKYITYHDSFKYFEAAFSVPSFEALLSSHAAPAGAGRFVGFRDSLLSNDVTCLLSEPGASQALISNMTYPAIHIVQADPLGSNLAGTPDLYQNLLLNIAQALRTCLEN